MTPKQKTPATLHACRPGFEPVVCDALLLGDESRVCDVLGAGLVGVDGSASGPEPGVFERQRMHAPHCFALDGLKPLTPEDAAALFAPVLGEAVPWAWHRVAFDEADHSRVKRRLEGVERHARRWLKKNHPDRLKLERKSVAKLREDHYRVLQWWMTDRHLWVGGSPKGELLDPQPGGVWRMKQDDAAPSRSYLKAEEAFARMGVEPGPGQNVVDLGAAPGGWTWSCLRRGAEVWAIDNGPMKPTTAWEEFPNWHHLLENGLTWEAPANQRVDWILGDMLIPPGEAMGVLRRWLKRDDLKGMVFNVKLPQRQPVPAVETLRAFLDGWPEWNIEIRQLYHDRREVTLMGRKG